MRAGATLAVVWASLLASMLAFLVLAILLRPRLGQAEGLAPLTWMAISWCVLSTITAGLLQAIAAEADPAKARGLRVASFAVLESGVFLAGVAHLVSRPDYGIYAAAIPIAAMLALFPRSA